MEVDLDEVLALRRAFDSVRERQKDNLFPDLDDRKRRLKDVREFSVGSSSLIERVVESLERNGIRVLRASSAEDSIKLILREIKDEVLVVKSKSNVSKEIGLSKELERKGIKVVETDIGDRVLQLLDAVPSHPTGPVAHLSAEEIAHGLKERLGIELEPNAEAIVDYIRKDILESFEQARVGITGANALAADEGSIVIVHNEGNIFRAIRREKHIVLTGIDKIYPNLEEAINMIRILTYNATGAIMPSFIEVVSGISKTADVEKKFIPGVHDPKEVVVILLDNGRSKLLDKGYKEFLLCIGCGNCLVHCPVYNVVGSSFGVKGKLGGRGLALASIKDEDVPGPDELLGLCLSCGRCRINCPVDIDIPGVIKDLRGETPLNKPYYFLKSHLIWIQNLIRLELHDR